MNSTSDELKNHKVSCYCNKCVIFLIYTLIFICMLKILHAQFVHMYSETGALNLDQGTSLPLLLALPLSHTLVLYCLMNIGKYYDIQIDHSTCPFVRISTQQRIAPYCYNDYVTTLHTFQFRSKFSINKSMRNLLFYFVVYIRCHHLISKGPQAS